MIVTNNLSYSKTPPNHTSMETLVQDHNVARSRTEYLRNNLFLRTSIHTIMFLDKVTKSWTFIGVRSSYCSWDEKLKFPRTSCFSTSHLLITQHQHLETGSSILSLSRQTQQSCSSIHQLHHKQEHLLEPCKNVIEHPRTSWLKCRNTPNIHVLDTTVSLYRYYIFH